MYDRHKLSAAHCSHKALASSFTVQRPALCIHVLSPCPHVECARVHDVTAHLSMCVNIISVQDGQEEVTSSDAGKEDLFTSVSAGTSVHVSPPPPLPQEEVHVYGL